MMHEIFDAVIERAGTDSMKWDVKEGVISMGIADMDFKAAPCIQEALRRKVEFGVFGYADIPQTYYESYQHWWEERHGWKPDISWMIFSIGIVPAISSMVRKLTTPAEQVLILSPVYNIFYNSIFNNGRVILSSPLIYADGEYHIDFDDLERKLADPQTTLMIFCNPHNPIGKIWDAETLEKVGMLCDRHHVTVISDEIHCDLCAPGRSYVPFASVNETNKQICVTCVSASKAFNLAGLQSACIIVADPVLRHKVWRGLNTDEAAEPNVFACDATIAAFSQGAEWLDALRVYLQRNREAAERFLTQELPKMRPVHADATYLLWLDLHECGIDTERFCAFLYDHAGLKVAYGGEYGPEGNAFLRINMAVANERLVEGLRRLKTGYEAFLTSSCT